MKHITELSNKDKKYINLAYDLAFDHEGAFRAKICAIIVYKNKISFGLNSTKSDPFVLDFRSHEDKIHIHAEMNAIKNAFYHKGFDQELMSKSTMYVARSKKDGSWGLARPCQSKDGKGCYSAIKTFGIKKVIYTTNEKDIVGIIENS